MYRIIDYSVIIFSLINLASVFYRVKANHNLRRMYESIPERTRTIFTNANTPLEFIPTSELASEIVRRNDLAIIAWGREAGNAIDCDAKWRGNEKALRALNESLAIKIESESERET